MPKDLEARIRRIEDFQQIKNLQAKYSFLVDTSKFDDLVELFATEFIWEVGFDEMTKITTKSDLLDLMKKADKGSSMTIHQPITPYIELDGDTAKGTWYLFGMLTSVTSQGEDAKWIQGKYNNRYIREDGEWKIDCLSFQYNFLTPYDEGWAKTPIARFWN